MENLTVGGIELKSGMLVETDKGLGLVLINTGKASYNNCIVGDGSGKGCWGPLNTSRILRVWNQAPNRKGAKISSEGRTPLWERVPSYTMEELHSKIGHKFTIKE